MADVRSSVEHMLPNADILVPEYSTWLLSNTTAIKLANALNDTIDEAFNRKPEGYEEVILIGHSIGSLLARKAYVIARGETEEVPVENFRQRSKTWASRVSRIVLMAGMNRGWSLSVASRPMLWPKAAVIWLGSPVARILGVGKLILGLQRGSPFVSNLTLQWLKLSQGVPLPPVIQLLGTDDDIVAEADNIDFLAGQNFFYMRLSNTGHANVVDFQEALLGAKRRETLEFSINASIEALRTKNVLIPSLRPDPEVKKVIFVMHGIRDFGEWTSDAKKALLIEADRKKTKAHIITSGYGYFSMGGFLLFGERQKNVRWFVDRYTQAKALYPKAAIEYLAHSNGTYLLASALRDYRSIDVDRVVFAGSVVRRDFDWGTLLQAQRVRSVRNYVATADWVVGFFPYFYELLNYSDIGGAGLLGFTSGDVNQIRYVPGQHGAAIGPQNLGELAAFLIGPGDTPPSSTLLQETQCGLIVAIARICWIVWLVLALVLIYGGYAFACRWQTDRIGRWPRAVLYAFTILLLLNTV